MKIVDNAVSIEANNQGTLNVSYWYFLFLILRSSNVTVFMETTFSSVVAVDTDMTTVISIRMRIEIKSLMKALASIQIEPKAVHFCMEEFSSWFLGFNDVAMIIYVIMKGNVGSITYYIPGQIMEDSFVFYDQVWKIEYTPLHSLQWDQMEYLNTTSLRQIMSEDFVSQCCDKASECIYRGELDKATRYLKKAMDRDPSNTRALELLTIIAGKKRKEESNCTFLILV